MKQVLKYAGYIVLLIAAGFLIWRFYFILAWILLAAVLSFIGNPLVRFYGRMHIRQWRIARSFSTLLALLTLILIFFGLLAVFIPLIVNQAETISNIDVDMLARNLQSPMQWLDDKMHALNILMAGQTLQDFIISKAKSLVNLGNITSFIDHFFGVAGTLFVGLFSVLFIAFFFMKDETLFENGLLLLVPEEHHQTTHKVITDSKHLLVRYFIGVLLEVICVMTLISLGLWLLGVKNALLIGFFGGLMNIIPYLGPLIGTLIGLMLGITATLAAGSYDAILPLILKLLGVFFAANFIDNNVLVPMIYSSSVKAHPLEIFFVIIMGGSLAGMLGMLLAIPVYTVLRVIAREFLQKFRIVQKLTEKIN
jgi:predicted PurR-regulated permease PerM